MQNPAFGTHQPRKSPHALAPSTRRNYANWSRQRTLSPRLRHALELYHSGAVRTQKEAAAIVGVCPQNIGRVVRHSEAGRQFVQEFNGEIRRKVVDMAAVIQGMSEKALERMNTLMDSNSEKIQLDAAKDILDRNPETSKTRKVQVESLSLTGRDVQSLAAALTRGAELKQLYAQAAVGDYTPALDNVK